MRENFAHLFLYCLVTLLVLWDILWYTTRKSVYGKEKHVVNNENFKRGTIELVVLAVLRQKDMYGYEIVKALSEKSAFFDKKVTRKQKNNRSSMFFSKKVW